MHKKAEKIRQRVREALINGASRHRVAERIVIHSREFYPDNWKAASIAQLVAIYRITQGEASALVGEMS